MAARRRSEEETLQLAVIAHIERRAVPGLMWWHTPNGMKAGGKRVGRKQIPLPAIRMKRMGAKAGVPDLLFFYRSHLYALELKTPGNNATASQSEWMANLHDNGGSGCVCHDLDRALRVLECWGLLRGSLVGGDYGPSAAVLGSGANTGVSAPVRRVRRTQKAERNVDFGAEPLWPAVSIGISRA